ncbi:DUF4351 domain-containing protein [Aliibacillus thermotolerans]|uniref:DUF4351 domain-containing protein n=1 Tax=Aliibacillus thermotolerans TaxID=1834418 RepID=A0ABW0UB61_9BACI|nr:DUF4351 domain-containing protein [Aliibacillus thermotolerans]
MLRYIFSTAKDLTENEVEQIITTLETTNMKGSEFVMTLADKWRQEGMEKGREEGKAEGMRLGLVKSITRICMKKFGELPKEMRDELNQLDVSSLEAILENIFEMERLEDVKKFIR